MVIIAMDLASLLVIVHLLKLLPPLHLINLLFLIHGNIYVAELLNKNVLLLALLASPWNLNYEGNKVQVYFFHSLSSE